MGISITKRGHYGILDAWIADRAACTANSWPKIDSPECLKSRVLHVNLHTQNATTILIRDDVYFLDVAAVTSTTTHRQGAIKTSHLQTIQSLFVVETSRS